MEPFLAQMWGFIMNLDRLPGLVTLLATGCCVIGVYYVEVGSRDRKKPEKSDDISWSYADSNASGERQGTISLATISHFSHG